jgi:hypothetical protein
MNPHAQSKDPLHPCSCLTHFRSSFGIAGLGERNTREGTSSIVPHQPARVERAPSPAAFDVDPDLARRMYGPLRYRGRAALQRRVTRSHRNAASAPEVSFAAPPS